MKYLVMACVFGLVACTGATEQVKESPLSYQSCSDTKAQKVLTFCASPEAASGVAALQAVHEQRVGGKSGDDLGPIPIGNSPSMGAKDAPVTIVMFTDLQCPFCSKAHAGLKQILQERPNDVRLVFKHAPLPFHENAVPAAVGAIAAGEQGKFWEFVELAYQNQDTLSLPELPALAGKLGLDIEKFKAAFENEASLNPVREDLKLAQELGVQGTPTFFVNGVREIGAIDHKYLNDRIDQQIELRSWLVDAGVESEDLYWRLATLNYKALPEPEAEEVPEPPNPVVGVPTEDAPAIGAEPDATLVTIVEFSDFECPFCRKGAKVIKEVLAKYPEVRVTYRHFPLDFHEHAFPAAIISTLAQEKGTFWAYHDRMFAVETELTQEILMKIAVESGMTEDQIKAHLADETKMARVMLDMQMAKEAGVSGTPTFFVNGIRVSGAQPIEVFTTLIDEQLELAKKVQAEGGLKGDALYRALVAENAEK